MFSHYPADADASNHVTFNAYGTGADPIIGTSRFVNIKYLDSMFIWARADDTISGVFQFVSSDNIVLSDGGVI